MEYILQNYLSRTVEIPTLPYQIQVYNLFTQVGE